MVTEMNVLPSGKEPVQIGSGVIKEMIGQGGSARVYKIWNSKLEIFRAIKLLMPGQNEMMNKRIETEAKITAQLRHPNIIEIQDVGVWNGLPYIEMEYLEGDTLDKVLLEKGRVPNGIACSIAMMIARALDYAHSQFYTLYGKEYNGIIHRDLKPSNIMILESGRVKIMDFGIARPIEANLHTIEKQIIGTVQYLSPEQINSKDVDHRTDYYSFGCILYEMLTGAKTFGDETITEILRNKVTNTYRSVKNFDVKVNDTLAKIVQKCLNAEKKNRYCTAKEIIEFLSGTFRKFESGTADEMVKAYLCGQYKEIEFTKKQTNAKKITLYVVVILGVVMVVVANRIYLTNRKSKTENRAESIDLPQTKSSILNSMVKDNTPVNRQTLESQNPVSHEVAESGKEEKLLNNNSVVIKSLFDQAKEDYSRKRYKEALEELQKATVSKSDEELKKLMMMDLLIKMNQIAKVKELLSSYASQDAQYDYLLGEYYQSTNETDKALDFYSESLMKPSKYMELGQIRYNASFNMALIYHEKYRINHDEATKEQVKRLLNNVFKYCKDTLQDTYRSARKIDAEIEK